MWSGIDDRIVSTAAGGLLVAVLLGVWQGDTTGPLAGVLVTLVPLVPSTIVIVIMDRRKRNLAHEVRKQHLLEKFAPPKPDEKEYDE